jgi:hypothetical protein
VAKLDRILDRYDLKTLEVALARRQARAAAGRRRELEVELSKLTTLIGGASTRVAGRGRAQPIKRKPNARRLNKITLAAAIEQVFKERKKPTHYKDLTDTILKRKIYVTKSNNLLSTVAVTLKRDKRFRKLKPVSTRCGRSRRVAPWFALGRCAETDGCPAANLPSTGRSGPLELAIRTAYRHPLLDPLGYAVLRKAS